MSLAELAREYLDANGTVEPIRTMARRLRDLHPDWFAPGEKGLESARKALRGALGQCPGHTKKTHHKEPGHQSDRPKMPSSASVNRAPYMLPPGKWLIQSDHHFPYHNVEAIQASFDYCEDWDGILLNGDQIDFHRISRFVSDADAVSTDEELRRFAEFLDWLRELAGDRLIVHKEGNHEERLTHSLAAANSDLAKIDKFRLPSLLDYEERGIEWVGDRRAIKAGHLTIFHGHELDRGFIAPVNPAKGLWDRTGISAMCGHFHRTSEHSHRNADNKTSVCWTAGCLCDLTPLYSPYNKWSHGFAILNLNQDGSYRLDNKRIIEGEVF